MAADDENDMFAEIRRKLAENRVKEKREEEKRRENRRKNTKVWKKKNGKARRTKRTAETVANAEESAVDIDELGAKLREAREREERRNATTRSKPVGPLRVIIIRQRPKTRESN